jgi:hypothetical protein
MLDEIDASHNGTPGSQTRACTNCAKAKAKCAVNNKGGKCER